MFQFVRTKASKTFVILAMLGMVMNAFAYTPTNCACSEVSSVSEIAQTQSGCCSSQSEEKSCCAHSATCCCTGGEQENQNSACGCGGDCSCGTAELPVSPGSAPQIPCSNTQDFSKELTTSSAVAVTELKDIHLPSLGQRLRAQPIVFVSALETCALLSRFTC